MSTQKQKHQIYTRGTGYQKNNGWVGEMNIKTVMDYHIPARRYTFDPRKKHPPPLPGAEPIISPPHRTSWQPSMREYKSTNAWCLKRAGDTLHSPRLYATSAESPWPRPSNLVRRKHTAYKQEFSTKLSNLTAKLCSCFRS